ncbi:hypothetical protein KJ780_04875 [Candidatus Micrarchaeota archaeon]|nr:hypothetical protein [Candidatus Micrarchaeota archaeon]
MKKYAVFAAIVILFGIASAQEPLKADNLLRDGLGIAVLLLTISALIVAITYMIGNLISNDKVKGWAKTEIVEIFYSFVLFTIVVSVYTIGTDTVMKTVVDIFDKPSADQLCGATVPATLYGEEAKFFEALPCHLRVARNFMTSTFYDTAGLVKAVGITHSWYTWLSSFSYDLNFAGNTVFFGGGSLNFAPLTMLNAKNNGLGFIFENGIKIMMLTRFQEVLITYIGTVLFPIFLVGGLLLRSLALTRKLGGLMLALAFSLYFIYPIFYIFGDAVYNSAALSKYGNTDRTGSTTPVIAKTILDFNSMPEAFEGMRAADSSVKTDPSAVNDDALAQLGFITDTRTLDTIQTNAEAEGDPDSVLGASVNPFMGKMLSSIYRQGGKWDSWNPVGFNSVLLGIDALSKALFFSGFFGLVSIFATIAAVKSLSPMLGGDVEIAGLTHLI